MRESPDLCSGRVAIVTGAGRGIGRGEALELARQGASVVVNDLGVATDGSKPSTTPAEEVAAEIRDAGGRAIANHDDVSDWDRAHRLVDTAVSEFGQLDIVVNNAGILRDRMLVNMTPEEWDAVISVHLRGTFAVTRHAAAYWRERAKAGQKAAARIINTSSSSGIYGNVGQTNYGAAKAGIAAFTIIAAQELRRYGVTVNAVAPGALTRMTEDLGRSASDTPDGFNPRHPDNIAPLVVWLASTSADSITGRVFNVRGGHISVAEGWSAGPAVDKEGRWEPAELSDLIPGLVARARGNAGMDGRVPDEPPAPAPEAPAERR
ncbi:NAD(P)-dependent dehydrogenase (short-subunit alcohol dehydrogenase family) [Lipingzhangella halophila]|uniref:NAD(P)-dependent dehydrogenase (Short-subunit alcohol dehydrogenase family) n=1 Tax=Lipingzhangella halophila TaxID=1783352 RepID=A0A7W7REC7_9ACTN|nr:SDR family oxidoreductase [Lipingzhangella halophila]MBB4930439.1 NAD(P)-dependent dehydrogenase (short-subunit alcohol dehydrogenase family) [Lipingzhangella halophila]